MKKLLFVFGTRPEAIKMAPLIDACRKIKSFEVKVCLTGQHKEMLQQVLDFFQIEGDYKLELMQTDQTLFDITSKALVSLKAVFDDYIPDIVLVQGDTTTAFVGALSAFYKKIKVAHVEAGLRTLSKYSPFPEEINRKMISSLADFHFTPTEKATENLKKENVLENVFTVGNTVIDALLMALEKVRDERKYAAAFKFLDLSKKIILITGHRRESFGIPFKNICEAISALAQIYPQIQFVYPLHLNPNIQKIVREEMDGSENIFLIKPLDYPHLVWLMDRCYFVISDSGGIQEEAPTLGKPVLVIRGNTEREEGIKAGTAILVGTDKERIMGESIRLIEDINHYEGMSKAVNPYGRGDSSQQIVSILLKVL
jgi:UDP-N-acetylglucosamine 2-epimerase (non-hydrolysing)